MTNQPNPTNQIEDLTAQRDAYRAAVVAMWPIFALALSYGEHGRPNEAATLRRMADGLRMNPPEGLLDAIFLALENS